ncbi:MAG: acyl-ACP--UDP-N-acetylglucosamine O-acyltransferase [Pseudomonadota bacterium]
MSDIHSTAIVDPGAKLGKDVVIGPFCTIGPNVVLGDGVELVSHVVVDGHTTIGSQTRVFPFACLGLRPQDLKYRGEPSTLEIGSNCMIREYVTMNPGTQGGGMRTAVGDECLLMACVHIAHDCVLGNNVILANAVLLAGHVIIEDNVRIGGMSAVNQFVSIGAHAFIGGMTGVERNVIPHGRVVGERGELRGINVVGLQRRNIEKQEIRAVRGVYKKLFNSDLSLSDAVTAADDEFGSYQSAQEVVGFARRHLQEGLLGGRDDSDD